MLYGGVLIIVSWNKGRGIVDFFSFCMLKLMFFVMVCFSPGLRCGDVHAASSVFDTCHEIHPALSHIFHEIQSTNSSTHTKHYSILKSPMN